MSMVMNNHQKHLPKTMFGRLRSHCTVVLLLCFCLSHCQRHFCLTYFLCFFFAYFQTRLQGNMISMADWYQWQHNLNDNSCNWVLRFLKSKITSGHPVLENGRRVKWYYWQWQLSHEITEFESFEIFGEEHLASQYPVLEFGPGSAVGGGEEGGEGEGGGEGDEEGGEENEEAGGKGRACNSGESVKKKELEKSWKESIVWICEMCVFL